MALGSGLGRFIDKLARQLDIYEEKGKVCKDINSKGQGMTSLPHSDRFHDFIQSQKNTDSFP